MQKYTTYSSCEQSKVSMRDCAYFPGHTRNENEQNETLDCHQSSFQKLLILPGVGVCPPFVSSAIIRFEKHSNFRRAAKQQNSGRVLCVSFVMQSFSHFLFGSEGNRIGSRSKTKQFVLQIESERLMNGNKSGVLKNGCLT